MQNEKWPAKFYHFLPNLIFLSAIAITILISIFLYFQFNTLLQEQNSITQSYQTIFITEQLSAYPTKENILQIKNTSNKLIDLTKNDPIQNFNITKFLNLVNQEINTDLTNNIKENLFQDIQLIANSIIEVEYSLIQEKKDSLNKIHQVINVTFIGGSIFCITLLLLAFLLFNREIVKRKNAEQNHLKIAHEKLIKEMKELKDKNEKITLLLEMSDITLTCSSMQELGNIIAKYCGKVFDFSTGAFYIMHPSKDFLEINGTWGNHYTENNKFSQDGCWALRLGHIHYCFFSDTELVCDHINSGAKKDIFYICVPLRAQNDIFGLLYIEISKENRTELKLNQNEKFLISAFAELAALSLANVRLRENLRYQSVRDPLTSLYNRRYLEEFLSKQIAQAERINRPLALLLIDLDHFKSVNDAHGHDAGDLVLKELGHILTNQIRAGDLASRYGGEEFIIILYDATLEVAQKRAEMLRKVISMMHVKYGAHPVNQITASIGVSIYPQDGRTKRELIEVADKALYMAKNNGRNQVVLSSGV